MIPDISRGLLRQSPFHAVFFDGLAFGQVCFGYYVGVFAHVSLVRGFCGELVARVAADAKAVGGVFERGVHEVHAEDDDITGLKWRGGPGGAEGFYDIVGVVGERALDQVVVCIRCAVGIAEMFEFVGSQAEGEWSHVERDIAQSCPHGIEIVGARAHIYNVAVHSRVAPPC